MSDIHNLLLRVIADVVGIRSLDDADQFESSSVENPAFAVLTVAQKDSIKIRSISDTLSLLLSGDLLDEFAGLEIDDIKRVVGKVGNKQPVALRVDCHVIVP